MRFRDTLTRSPPGFNSLEFLTARRLDPPGCGPTDLLTPPALCDYSNCCFLRTAPSSSLVQDTCLSRMQHGFESRRGHFSAGDLAPIAGSFLRLQRGPISSRGLPSHWRPTMNVGSCRTRFGSQCMEVRGHAGGEYRYVVPAFEHAEDAALRVSLGHADDVLGDRLEILDLQS